MDDSIQDAINGLAGHVGFIDLAMKTSARDIIYLTPLLLLALWFWPVPNSDRALNQRVAAAAFLGVLLGLGFAMLLGSLHNEARPFISDTTTKLLIPHAPDNSFPSDHATAAFALAGAIVWWRKSLGFVLLGVALLIGFSRVYVGVHWPQDVAAAAAAGIVAGAVVALCVPLLAIPQRWFSRMLPPFLLAAPS
ncbi:MAG TPA: phosphatase PAP2 family protein [Dehalococcoidia bacterium]|nr:phosphatase PAP2 family protein [Dehalococcoidia bacterium]